MLIRNLDEKEGIAVGVNYYNPPERTIIEEDGKRYHIDDLGKRKYYCKIIGCDNLSHTAGLCSSHGIKRHKKLCIIDGCPNTSKAKGVCRKHGYKSRTCLISGCNNTNTNKGFCPKHGSIDFKLLCNLRSRLKYALNGTSKSARTMELIGCTTEFLREYLSSKFIEGMSWDNYGGKDVRLGWHMDHIIPCASFDMKDAEQQKRCFHYTNLQPLWGIDNLRKGRKIIV